MFWVVFFFFFSAGLQVTTGGDRLAAHPCVILRRGSKYSQTHVPICWQRSAARGESSFLTNKYAHSQTWKHSAAASLPFTTQNNDWGVQRNSSLSSWHLSVPWSPPTMQFVPHTLVHSFSIITCCTEAACLFFKGPLPECSCAQIILKIWEIWIQTQCWKQQKGDKYGT